MSEQNRKTNYVVIGFMGSGKTTIGRRIAALSGREFFDTDVMIEQETGVSVTEIFAAEGEEGFRRRETQLLQKLVGEGADGRVYATGGGMILRQENRDLLHRLGEVVWLQVKPQTVIDRLSGDTTRPLLQGDDRMRKVTDLMQSRRSCYEDAADFAVSVDGRRPAEIARQILCRENQKALLERRI
ncbi:MAG: shikimate kinase [Eubacteriales bacterium]|nr:shikimate kinase [Eubacteriales bacterium]